MKLSRFFLAPIALLFAFSCTLETELEPVAPEPSPNAFYASIENNGISETKAGVDEAMHIYWDSDDEISIFNHGTNNARYKYSWRPGANSGLFNPVSENDAVVGNELPYAYAVYPYAEDMTISQDGVVSLTLPDVQHNFGPGDNAMIAVSENNILFFRNMCGYLVIQCIGNDCAVKSISLRANGGESIAGPATVNMQPGGVPEVSMQNGSDEITMELDTPVSLSANFVSNFCFVVPPVTLSQGFTITITDNYGGTFTKSSSKELVIPRNKISRMEEINVDAIVYEDIQIIADELYKVIGQPCRQYNYPDDLEFLSVLFCNDLEGADAFLPATGYNWFSVCGEYARANNYRNVAIRYNAPANMIAMVNRFIGGIDVNTASEANLAAVAQLRALRAWSYMLLAQNYQFTYLTAQDQPCLPIITSEQNENPRATVAEIYEQILADLNYAVANLDGFSRTSRAQINKNVALGLRARVHLLMGNWEAAYNDAAAAAEGFVPAGIAEVSHPAFCDISEHNWIWGFDMEAGGPASYSLANAKYSTTSCWLRSFSGYAYSTSCQVYCCINSLLWDKIPATDVRKGWWVNEELESPLLDGLVWPGYSDVATADDGGLSKLPYIPYTNVKFGCNSIGTKENDEDMPLMRVEEMLLIQAEAKAHTDPAAASQILEDFVKAYRDPSYSVASGGRSLQDEIWFQRRVELWGEGFGVLDNLRLGKPVVRFHEGIGNYPDKYRFNIEATDPRLLLLFPASVLSGNPAIVDNPTIAVSSPGLNPDLRDGVTD